MESRTDLTRKLRDLFDGQRIGVLSTQRRNRPYASLVAFAATDDLKCFVFATPRTTRKYANIMASSRAALLIDNRSNKASDFRRAMAVTVVGTVRELKKTKRSRLVKLYKDKQPIFEQMKIEKEEEREKIEGQKMEIAWGSQIRSYVLHPYRMVKDHRTGHETGNVDSVLDGDLDDFIQAYLMGRREQ